MTRDPVRQQLVRLLDGVDAHMPFEAAVEDFPDEAMNERPPNVGYTPWHLIEHLRLTQWDILDYVTNPDYVRRAWPREYWPDPSMTATRAAWDASLAGFVADRAALRALVTDDARDLFAVIPGTPGHTLLREVRIVGDHNAYHLGEFAILRQVMGTWPAGHEG
jgi:DinB superfamily